MAVDAIYVLKHKHPDANDVYRMGNLSVTGCNTATEYLG